MTEIYNTRQGVFAQADIYPDNNVVICDTPKEALIEADIPGENTVVIGHSFLDACALADKAMEVES